MAHQQLVKAIYDKNEAAALELVDAVVAAGDLEKLSDPPEGRTPLEEAALFNMRQLCEKLLEKGAVCIKEGGDPKALFCAVEAGAPDTVEVLVGPSAAALGWKFRGIYTALATAMELDEEREEQKAAFERIVACLKAAGAPM
mmetsp:Transcript_12831/g.15507  ORF Transcript_12831/g.15507 Transcript_12831/m.15507 type:complete len:142 (+) Transcript_12831:167-592(+)|eukprot:CAMPEP_0197868474 /NCGR_PEP_ID=MMETSP1438-20131217/45300_1 /TAXON_ID=1461541 /ORGANISM="Pterosperma sp., Strain CCMP1384" /LENGTH=141 /DNA_ID=CAMNT_0043487181 /DNA_START=167 /DNA_END=592 /DNA_ORIENTATION=+